MLAPVMVIVGVSEVRPVPKGTVRLIVFALIVPSIPRMVKAVIHLIFSLPVPPPPLQAGNVNAVKRIKNAMNLDEVFISSPELHAQ